MIEALDRLPGFYDAGTATVSKGATSVFGQGTSWLNAVYPNDYFWGKSGHSVRIVEVFDETLTLAMPWPGENQEADTYEVRIADSGARVPETTRQLLDVLSTRQFFMPDDSGTLAMRASQDGRLRGFSYLVTSGTGVGLYYKASDASADWAGPYAYAQGDKGDTGPIAPFTFGSPVAVAPDANPAVANTGTPTAPNLVFSIPRGQGVRDRGNYAGGTAYDAYDTVLNNGSTWIALVTGPAGVAPPVLPTEANAKWRLFARKGTDGAGDLTGPSSSTTGAIARFSGTTGKIITSGPFTSLETNLDNYTAEGSFITPASGLTNLPPGWPQGRYTVEACGGIYAYQLIHRPTGGFAHRSWNGVTYSTWAEYGVDASLLTSGTIPDARVPSLAASKIGSGTFADARISATLTPDKAFRRGNILGTVSQSSGVPTGGIIERGSNANGEYTKFADGTMECWIMTALFEYLSASNLQYTWTYPASFIAGPYISLGVLSSSGSDYQGSFFPKSPVLLGSPQASSAALYLRGQTSWEAGQFANNQRLFAKGRWF